MSAARGPLDDRLRPCDHNLIPCRGGWRHLFRAGWVCVRCDSWSKTEPPRIRKLDPSIEARPAWDGIGERPDA